MSEIGYSLSELIFLFLLFGIPAAVLLWFIISLVLFLKCDSSDKPRYRRRMFSLLISAVIIGVMILAVIALIILFSLAIAHM